MGRLLCWLGLHSWKLSDGVGVSHGGAFVIFYKKDCRRCGKHVGAVMAP